MVLARHSVVALKTSSLTGIDNERESHTQEKQSMASLVFFNHSKINTVWFNSIPTSMNLEMHLFLAGFEAILQSTQSEGVEVLHNRESVYRSNL